MLRVDYITYQEAQRLIPILQALISRAKSESMKEGLPSARRILEELKVVRDVDYSPTKGHQIFLSDKDYELLQELRMQWE